MSDEEVVEHSGFNTEEKLAKHMEENHEIQLEHWRKLKPNAKFRLYLWEEFGVTEEE